MSGRIVDVVGWIGVTAFFGRFLVQWIATERARRSITPRSFWWISLGGSLALGTYCLLRGEHVLLAGIATNSAIYARNLVLAHRTVPRPPFSPRTLFALLGVAGVLLVTAGSYQAQHESTDSAAWMTCVLIGQSLWSARFLLPWWVAERRGEPILSPAFWWTSLLGNVLLLAYSIHLADWVLIAGYLLGPLVQIRNLVLGRRGRRENYAVVARSGAVSRKPARSSASA